jgi:beta-lactamase regulating signal transducer with metallopeptidase domain
MAAVLLCPFVALFMPQVDIPLFSMGIGAADPVMGPEGEIYGSEDAPGMLGTQFLLFGYVLGVVLVLVWQLIGRLYANRLRRRAQPADDPKLLGSFNRVKARLGTRGTVALVLSDVASIPFSTGFFRPAVVLPKTAGEWPSEVLRTVLVHELGHVKRRDILTRALAQLSCSLHWVNPIAWYGLRRVLIEGEIACDDLVLKSGTRPSAYARALLILARAGGGKLSFATTALGRHGELKDRLLEILKPKRSKAPLDAAGMLAGLFVALVFLAPVSALNLWKSSGVRATPSIDVAGFEAAETAKEFETQLLEETEKESQKTSVRTPPRPEAPDLKKEKELIEKKTQTLKEDGASEEEIKKFVTDAKKKLAQLEKQYKESKASKEADFETQAKMTEKKKGKVREP